MYRAGVLILTALTGACIDVAPADVDIPVDLSLFGGDNSFVVRGTAAIADNNGPCPVWFGDNGVAYHLFQSPRLDNDVFDRVTTEGTTSRLVLSLRSDLELDCAFGRTAQVIDVLEIVE